MTEAAMKHTGSKYEIQLTIKDTQEVYTDLLKIYEINLKHVDNKNNIGMQTLKEFFNVTNEDEYVKFCSKYIDDKFGQLLIKNYELVVSDVDKLENLSKEDKYMIRLTDEERLLERKEGKEEGRIDMIKNMLKINMDINTIAEVSGLDIEDIENIKLKIKTNEN